MATEPGGAKRYGIALIGTGFMGGLHARAYNTIQQVYRDAVALPMLTVVADVREEDASAAATRWGFSRWTSRWEDAIADPAVDIVDICTPPALHRTIAEAAARAGKHVYCEKPVGRNREETEAVLAAVRAAGVRSFVGFNYRWSPAVQYAREIVTSGRLGEIRLVKIWFRTEMAADAGSDFRWRYAANEAGYGALGDVGSHVFDMARNLVGEIVEVCGRTVRSVDARPDAAISGGELRAVTNDDSFAALVTFANGATGVFDGSRVATGCRGDFGFELFGSKGALRWNMQRVNELELHTTEPGERDRGFTLIRTGPEHEPFGHFVPSPLGIGYLETKVIEAEQFLRSLAEGRVISPSVEDAAVVARLLEAVPLRRWVTV